ncbi:4-hydroxythreonine-4-phosphate dehydrogenase PdxA [Candidatus Poribacteria bacterium]|nr:4-hydroxythreonine-4-phosphate dehydrogenase PdxA [Candidatus Poribacteria bacterium]
MNKRPLIGISAGDPAGIGPEIIAKALSRKEIYDICQPLVISDFGLMEDALRIANVDLKLNRISEPSEGRYEFWRIDVLDMKNVDMSKLVYKKIAPENGKAAFEYIKKLIELALDCEIDATVTAPIHKGALNAAGFHYAGHTEIYAELTGTENYGMLLADDNLRIIHVTTHVPLRKALDMITKDRILRNIRLVRDMLEKLGIKDYTIAAAGLNPHAGEGGLFGHEEIKEIIPAVESAKVEGINVVGPIPTDTIFSRARGGEFDAVVAMYHDQGHIAMKTAGFIYNNKSGKWSSISGVNVTLGLPIIRTSVDHGVAFDKAGDGKANPQSMIQAIKMAVNLAK